MLRLLGDGSGGSIIKAASLFLLRQHTWSLEEPDLAGPDRHLGLAWLLPQRLAPPAA